MENIGLKLKKGCTLYRELFLNTAKSFKEVINKHKADFSCGECGVCCKIRYSKLSPEEIMRLANEENDPTAIQYLELFVPYEVMPEHDYAKFVLAKHDEPIYFYYCKHAENRDNCERKDICKDFPDSITTILPEECSFRHWQKLITYQITNKIAPDIHTKMQEIIDHRNNFQCNRTGTCCNLASSEFTYEELQEKAQNNDEFAKQFISIFVPYKDIEVAKKIYPEYVELLLSRIEENETANFYYCKHLQGKNVCPIYEDRPQICRDFPDNPLTIIPEKCGYHQWKEDILVASYTYHAMSQVYGFYYEKITDALE